MTDTLDLVRPDDWHLHLRDGAMLRAVLPASARVFGRAIIMPNLVPPVANLADVAAYRRRILDALPQGARFEPLMTLYLTETTKPEDIRTGRAEGALTAVKLYPAGATTNSDAGVRDLVRVAPVLEAMQEVGVPLLVHGEVTDPDIDIFDREAVFVERVLAPLRRDFPALKVVLEHVTTRQGVDYVRGGPEATGGEGALCATITPHHLMINRTDIFRGGIRPHLYCLPIAKREEHRLALRDAAKCGDARFFLGTDSAPHPVDTKENACGCAGVFNAAVAMSCYAQVFEEEGRLDALEGFASRHGPAFYGLEVNADRIRLERRAPRDNSVADIEVDGGGRVRVFRPDAGLRWSVADDGP